MGVLLNMGRIRGPSGRDVVAPGPRNNINLMNYPEDLRLARNVGALATVTGDDPHILIGAGELLAASQHEPFAGSVS